MLETAEAVAFLPSEDLERSERFFQGVLNLALVSRSPFASVFKVGAGTLRVTRVEALRPQHSQSSAGSSRTFAPRSVNFATGGWNCFSTRG